jgi:predicted Zn-dependent protease
MGIVTTLASYSSVSLSQEDDALDLSEILVFEANGDYRAALERLNTLKSEHPENDTLNELELRLLIASNRLHDATKLALDLPLTHPLKAQFEQASETAINRVVRNEKIAIIVIQKRIELQDFDSAILVADRALTRFPDPPSRPLHPQRRGPI